MPITVVFHIDVDAIQAFHSLTWDFAVDRWPVCMCAAWYAALLLVLLLAAMRRARGKML